MISFNKAPISLKTGAGIIVFSFLFLYFLCLIISAWITDDAFITLRTIDNFINGYGLRWNISERVQAYTHPLWMFLLSIIYFFTREPYYSTITVSIIISLFTVYLLAFKISTISNNSILILIALIFSKAFVDYSTSGLENPLTHLLITIFFIISLGKDTDRKIVLLSLITSIAAINRMDSILLLLPSLVFSIYKTGWRISIKQFLLGTIPLIAWISFSLFYYGFAFPNTAYAKLNNGINESELISQGSYYLLNSFYMDPLTLPVILGGLVIPFLFKRNVFFPAAFGILFYLIYIVIIGGDFMSGRFLSSPFLIAIIILSQTELRWRKTIIALSVIVFLGLMAPYPTIFSSTTYGLGPKIVKGFRIGPYILTTFDNGIADERLFYYQFTGLLNHKKLKEHPWVKKAFQVKEEKSSPIVYTIAGIFGYYAGPQIHIVDPWALGDPLLSKLPATEYWRVGSKIQPGEKWWRIGHFARKIPGGYLETIKTGEKHLEDKSLREYYDKLLFVIKGDLFDTQRLKEIINLNFGKYDYLVNAYNSKLEHH